MRKASEIRVYSGNRAILDNSAVFAELGERMLIVTSRTAGETSGALADVRTALDDVGILYSVCDSVRPNPDLDDCLYVARRAKEFGADALIGIGGGSPLDVIKIASILVKNDLTLEQLTDPALERPGIPLVAIPTTAGSGSEITRYAVILDHGNRSKKTIISDVFYPRVVFLDERYTERLPIDITRYTALDALSHLIEGYINKKATEESDAAAIEGLEAFGKVRAALTAGKFGPDDRARLLIAAHLGGKVIDITRSNVPHVMGYQLTYKYRIPHGRACALFLAEFLRFNAPSENKKIERLLAALDIAGIDELEGFISSLIGDCVSIDDREIHEMIPVIASRSKITNSPRDVSATDLFIIAKNSVGKR
ncbi:MAG: iron-containing alcohol dehydrogenase [Methanomassiliicoccaceae archaeon]|jgi:alcohol dehydrogenase|nr:iron-containing alcohol dehydrogenase [Methanomassiliicoccaceae archaeon]